mmetsp:Transcript_28473/g.51475  ORF Transcript_28473/g.51475 Transcript_28473/m.51475 type:complete len:632 (-) Transcript_28473:63-1958(-)
MPTLAGYASPKNSAPRAEELNGNQCLQDLNDEIHQQVLNFLSGSEAGTAQLALRTWRFLLQDDSWWRSRCMLECRADRLELTEQERWQAKYRQLLAARAAKMGTWCYRSRQHGLGDRVASPQMFIGPRGQKLFNYGGWIGRGPQTDLNWVSLETVSRFASAASSEEDPNAEWRFQRAEERGSPAWPGGVQSLTPLWFGSHGPSAGHVEATAAQLSSRGRDAGLTSPGGGDAGSSSGSHLVVAFGGGAGGYRNEHNSWAVGVLTEGESSQSASILWGHPGPGRLGDADADGEDLPRAFQPTNRCAHTATYVPPKLAGVEFPEGCVVVFGGHTNHCSVELSTVEVLSVHDWRWRPIVTQVGSRLLDDTQESWQMRDRHGHSTTLVEVDGKGYLVVIGGGIGNILENWRVEEFLDVAIMELENWSWIGNFELQCDDNVRGPGRHHAACAGLPGQILFMGGGRRPGREVCSLDASRCVRMALDGQVTGRIPLSQVLPTTPEGQQTVLPTGRKMHGAVCLLPWAPLVVTMGGWETGPHFDDLWVFAIGARQEDLQDFACLTSAGGSSEDEDEDEDDPAFGGEFVLVNLRGRDGEVRTLRIPRRMLAALQSGAIDPSLLRAGMDSDEEEEVEEDLEN